MDNPLQQEQEAILKIPLNTQNIREDLNFYKLIREIFREYHKDTDGIDFIISNLEVQATRTSYSPALLPDEEKIIEAVERHPYFKNPCHYPIRLITILKYLKQKGFNVSYTDIDLYIDRIMQRIDGVSKVGRGLYMKKK